MSKGYDGVVFFRRTLAYIVWLERATGRMDVSKPKGTFTRNGQIRCISWIVKVPNTSLVT